MQKQPHEENFQVVADNDSKYHSNRICSEDSSLFISLFNTMTQESENGDSPPPSCRSNQPQLVNNSLVFQSLDQQITRNIKESVQNVECVLLLPHLGEVRMQVSQHSNVWHINLTFMNWSALKYARNSQPMITKRLNESLGSPVVLGLFLQEEDDDSSDK